jgi:hypothetical protein
VARFVGITVLKGAPFGPYNGVYFALTFRIASVPAIKREPGPHDTRPYRITAPVRSHHFPSRHSVSLDPFYTRVQLASVTARYRD